MCSEVIQKQYSGDTDGHVYEGEVRGGKKHGHGTLYSPDGEILQEGKWENGEFLGE